MAGERISKIVQFLAYSGVRAFSEAQWITWEDLDWQRKEIVIRGAPATGTKNSEIRRVPMLPNMEELLLQLRGNSPDDGQIIHVPRCDQILDRACTKAGIPRITLHDLRHLFATRCIESGVDIPTVSRWLGHKDGGALAMKVYGHLRNEHSQQMAQKVRF
jgi:integrase